MGLIIGVDGGGTKSSYKVYDSDNQSIKDYCGDSINFYAMGEIKASLSIKKIIDIIIRSNSGSKIDSVYIGNAALGIGDTLTDNHSFIKTIKEYSNQVKVVSDLFIGLKGVGEIPAMFLISGTGSMAIGENSNGEIFTTGGWGHILGDQGSGYYIGIKGIREAIKSYEGFSPKTILIENVKEYFKVKSMEEIITKAYSDKTEKGFIAGFATFVLESSGKGDLSSIKIVEDAINYLVKHIEILSKKINYESEHLGIYGGCFQKSNLFLNLFKQKLLYLMPSIKVLFPKYTPVESALLLAAKEVDLKLEKKLSLIIKEKE